MDVGRAARPRDAAARKPEAARALPQLHQLDIQHARATDALAPERDRLRTTLTILDIPLGVLANRWFELPLEVRPELPRIKRHHELLSTRQAYPQHVIEAPLPPK